MTDEKQILKHLMVDISLSNGMENILLLIQQIYQIQDKEGEEQKGLDDEIHAVQQHIKSISTVYSLGLSWLKDETDVAFSFVKGR